MFNIRSKERLKPDTAEELESMSVQQNTWAGVNHKGDGTHSDIVADSINFGEPDFVTEHSVNALTNYQEGEWTPTLTFVTPGDLSITYLIRQGLYTLIGNVMHVQFAVVTSVFTHSTASGAAKITGLPFASSNANLAVGTMQWGTFTPAASMTNVIPTIETLTTTINIVATGPGQSAAECTTAHLTTGSSIGLMGSITYRTP